MVLELGQIVCREIIECLQGLRNTNTSLDPRVCWINTSAPWAANFPRWMERDRQCLQQEQWAVQSQKHENTHLHTLHVLRHTNPLQRKLPSPIYIIRLTAGLEFCCFIWLKGKTEEILMDGSHYSVSFNVCPSFGCFSLIYEDELVRCS